MSASISTVPCSPASGHRPRTRAGTGREGERSPADRARKASSSAHEGPGLPPDIETSATGRWSRPNSSGRRPRRAPSRSAPQVWSASSATRNSERPLRRTVRDAGQLHWSSTPPTCGSEVSSLQSSAVHSDVAQLTASASTMARAPSARPANHGSQWKVRQPVRSQAATASAATGPAASTGVRNRPVTQASTMASPRDRRTNSGFQANGSSGRASSSGQVRAWRSSGKGHQDLISGRKSVDDGPDHPRPAGPGSGWRGPSSTGAGGGRSVAGSVRSTCITAGPRPIARLPAAHGSRPASVGWPPPAGPR